MAEDRKGRIIETQNLHRITEGRKLNVQRSKKSNYRNAEFHQIPEGRKTTRARDRKNRIIETRVPQDRITK